MSNDLECPICGYDESWEDDNKFVCIQCGTIFNKDGKVIEEGTWKITQEIENLLMILRLL